MILVINGGTIEKNVPILPTFSKVNVELKNSDLKKKKKLIIIIKYEHGCLGREVGGNGRRSRNQFGFVRFLVESKSDSGVPRRFEDGIGYVLAVGAVVPLR